MHREFDASIPYMVSRVMTGYVEEVLAATDTLIITGDIEMDGMDVSLKMITGSSVVGLTALLLLLLLSLFVVDGRT